MAQDVFLDRMRQISRALPPTARVRLVLDELVAMVDGGTISFVETQGAANTMGLYKAGALWGAHVNFKANEFPSFVHELTHARCILCYAADTINYAPGIAINIPLAFGNAPPPGAPRDTLGLTEQCQNNRRNAWKRNHAKLFLDTNLGNLRAWAEVTDFTVPDPFMSATDKATIKQTTKAMNKGNADAMKRYGQLNIEAQLRGQVQKSGKWRGADAINAQRLLDEKNRKKAFVLERINYGLNGMSGLGDTHNEYDTVVNQMLLQMYLWGFRVAPALPALTLDQKAQHVQNNSLPAGYLYDMVSRLAEEAHLRRMAAQGIREGAAPTVTAPVVVIAAPE